MKVPSTKKILILGASGQLGSDLQSQLSSHKSRITFVRKSKWGKEFTNSKNRHSVSIDLLKISQIKLNSLISDADIIFHLAANTNVQVKSNNERNFFIDAVKLLAQKYEHKFKESVVIDINFFSTFVKDARSFKLAPSRIFLQVFKYKYNIETGFANLIWY